MWIKRGNSMVNIYDPNEKSLKDQIKELFKNNEGLFEQISLEIRQEKLNKIKNNLK
jgi:hypothetical protein